MRIPLNRTGNKVKGMAYAVASNDTPARSEKQNPSRGWCPEPGGRWMTTMSIDDPTANKGRYANEPNREETNPIVADLQCAGWGGWDARDVLAGRVDATTVRQAVEVER